MQQVCSAPSTRLAAPGTVRTAVAPRRWMTAALAGLMLGWLATLCLGVGTARAEPPGTADMRAIRGVIEAQLDALARDDAERAFSYASPEIREHFGNAERFMAMVKGSYGMLVKPAAVTFFVPDNGAQGLVQRVQVRDRNGQRWMAIYQMVPAGDGAASPGGWRINGCVVSPDASRAPST